MAKFAWIIGCLHKQVVEPRIRINQRGVNVLWVVPIMFVILVLGMP